MPANWGSYVYGGEEGTQVSSTYEGRHVSMTAAELVTDSGLGVATKGHACVFGRDGLQAVGVCLETGTGTDPIAVDTEGKWNLPVYGKDDDGVRVLKPGEPVFIDVNDGEISGERDNETQVPFGYLLTEVASGAETISVVKVHWDPRSHWLMDKERLIFGDDLDHVIYWTGEEIVIEGDRATLGDGGYYRCLHAGLSVALEAGDRWGTLSTYTTLAGGGGLATWAGAIVGSLVQVDAKQVIGYMAAGIFEAKNEADGCDTFSAINLVWKNQSGIGFGGLMHSFIRFDDTSPLDREVQCLFELHGMDATEAAAADQIVCQAGSATTISHCIKISCNGVPYWVGMDATPPA